MALLSDLAPASEMDEGVLLEYQSPRGNFGGLRLGPGARLRSGTILYAGTVIGARLQTGHNVIIREQNQLGDDVSIWSNTVIDYGCQIGDRVKIHCNGYVAQFSVLEDDVFFAPGVSVANDLYPGDEESARLMRGPVVRRGAQIGVNTTILPYVTIGENVLVGAGSVVTRDLPAGCVAYGNPARPQGYRKDLKEISSRTELLGVSGSNGERARSHGSGESH